MKYTETYSINFPPADHIKKYLEELKKIPVYAFIKDFENVVDLERLKELNKNNKSKYSGGKIVAYLFLCQLCEFSKQELITLKDENCFFAGYLEVFSVPYKDAIENTKFFSDSLEYELGGFMGKNKGILSELYFHKEEASLKDNTALYGPVCEEALHDLVSIGYMLGTCLVCSPQWYLQRAKFVECDQLSSEDQVDERRNKLFNTVKLEKNRKKAAEELKRLYPFLQASCFDMWSKNILDVTHVQKGNGMLYICIIGLAVIAYVLKDKLMMFYLKKINLK